MDMEKKINETLYLHFINSRQLIANGNNLSVILQIEETEKLSCVAKPEDIPKPEKISWYWPNEIEATLYRIFDARR